MGLGKIQPRCLSMEDVRRLNYIGSKYNLLEWITNTLQEVTGWTDFKERIVGDLFAGTGIVSYHFRQKGARVVSNDAELYSSIIAGAMTVGVYTSLCAEFIQTLNRELDREFYRDTVGTVTRLYSPYKENERKFFTVDNAQRIDYLRKRIAEFEFPAGYDRIFMIASLIISADAVSNVPAVYGCYLKEFKTKAQHTLVLRPVHQNRIPFLQGSMMFHQDVLQRSVLYARPFDVVYIDPPYNERQYSKNYFPLNIIACSPSSDVTVTGKTGIPTDCFLSPFCQTKKVAEAFRTVLGNLSNAKWVLISYSSEGLLSRNTLETLLSEFGEVTVRERDYKRFKSFEYNETGTVQEYLFCIRIRGH
jgi:adenine-specific DNA-methyltransferase